MLIFGVWGAPGINDRAARVVREVEDEREQLCRLEECATWAALGIDRPAAVAMAAVATTAIASTAVAAPAGAAVAGMGVDDRPAEGPATLAAESLAKGGGGSGGVGEPSQLPGSGRKCPDQPEHLQFAARAAGLGRPGAHPAKVIRNADEGGKVEAAQATAGEAEAAVRRHGYALYSLIVEDGDGE
jgi:hypothetical protein